MPETNNDQFKLEQLYNVKDKVCLVTGGATGIGLMAAQALAVNGAKVYIVGRTKERLDAAVAAHGQNISGQLIPLVADISQKEDIKRLVADISSREKCLCILINNAGISSNNQVPEGNSAEEMKKNLFDPEDATFEEWESTYRTNVPQIYFMTTAFLPLLQAATEHQHGFSGTVLNIGSISGLVKRAQNHFAYNASKAAAHHVTKLLASEIASSGLKIRINAIAPGVFPSEMTAKESGDNMKSELPKDKKGDLPSERPGNDRDMANAVLFAVTNQYLNGQIVAVDGGYLIQEGT